MPVRAGQVDHVRRAADPAKGDGRQRRGDDPDGGPADGATDLGAVDGDKGVEPGVDAGDDDEGDHTRQQELGRARVAPEVVSERLP